MVNAGWIDRILARPQNGGNRCVSAPDIISGVLANHHEIYI